MITANQLRAARALLNIDQRQTADLADLSVPTIQRMEASDGVIRGNVDSLMKLVSALENAGIELINPGVASSAGGRSKMMKTLKTSVLASGFWRLKAPRWHLGDHALEPTLTLRLP